MITTIFLAPLICVAVVVATLLGVTTVIAGAVAAVRLGRWALPAIEEWTPELLVPDVAKVANCLVTFPIDKLSHGAELGLYAAAGFTLLACGPVGAIYFGLGLSGMVVASALNAFDFEMPHLSSVVR